MYPDRPIVGVGAVILAGDRVLLVKRAHEPLKGEWSLPGGAVDIGEPLAEAVVREVREETCLVVDAGPIVEVVDRIYRDLDGRVRYHFVIVDYLCRATAGTPACGSDAAAVAWVGLGELAAYGVAEPAIAVIRKAVSLSSA